MLNKQKWVMTIAGKKLKKFYGLWNLKVWQGGRKEGKLFRGHSTCHCGHYMLRLHVLYNVSLKKLLPASGKESWTIEHTCKKRWINHMKSLVLACSHDNGKNTRPSTSSGTVLWSALTFQFAIKICFRTIYVFSVIICNRNQADKRI